MRKYRNHQSPHFHHCRIVRGVGVHVSSACYAYNVDWIFLSIAVLFPQVTIREAFRRRQLAIRAQRLEGGDQRVWLGLENNIKMPLDEKRQIHALMRALSERFTESLKDPEHQGMDEVRGFIRKIYSVSTPQNNAISGNASLKMMRVIQDIQENIESLNGIKCTARQLACGLTCYCRFVHRLFLRRIWFTTCTMTRAG